MWTPCFPLPASPSFSLLLLFPHSLPSFPSPSFHLLITEEVKVLLSCSPGHLAYLYIQNDLCIEFPYDLPTWPTHRCLIESALNSYSWIHLHSVLVSRYFFSLFICYHYYPFPPRLPGSNLFFMISFLPVSSAIKQKHFQNIWFTQIPQSCPYCSRNQDPQTVSTPHQIPQTESPVKDQDLPSLFA